VARGRCSLCPCFFTASKETTQLCNLLHNMARASRESSPPQAHKNKRKRRSTKASASRDTQSTDASGEPPSASQLLNQSLQTTDEWFKSVCTKKGYANYVKNGKKLLGEWTADQDDGGFVGVGSDRKGLVRAFDSITEHTPTALRLIMAYKCEHLGRAFSTAEGLRSAFKHFFER
jgi:hypothetical protein